MTEILALLPLILSIILLFSTIGAYEYFTKHIFHKMEIDRSIERSRILGEIFDEVVKMTNFFVVAFSALIVASIILIILYISAQPLN